MQSGCMQPFFANVTSGHSFISAEKMFLITKSDLLKFEKT
jgi:hypothetical protein